jgi:hypothetical protein
MYPMAIYPPVRQLDDRDARVRARWHRGGDGEVALRWWAPERGGERPTRGGAGPGRLGGPFAWACRCVYLRTPEL